MVSRRPRQRHRWYDVAYLWCRRQYTAAWHRTRTTTRGRHRTLSFMSFKSLKMKWWKQYLFCYLHMNVLEKARHFALIQVMWKCQHGEKSWQYINLMITRSQPNNIAKCLISCKPKRSSGMLTKVNWKSTWFFIMST